MYGSRVSPCCVRHCSRLMPKIVRYWDRAITGTKNPAAGPGLVIQ